jgi:hypothetical protein
MGQMSAEEVLKKRATDKKIAQYFFAARHRDIHEMAFDEVACRS